MTRLKLSKVSSPAMLQFVCGGRVADNQKSVQELMLSVQNSSLLFALGDNPMRCERGRSSLLEARRLGVEDEADCARLKIWP